MSSAASRKAAREYWNSPRAVRMAELVDWLYASLLTLAIMFAGSLNF